MNGVSKKFCILALVLGQISALAGSTDDKFPYAILVVVCFVSYLLVRFFGKD